MKKIYITIICLAGLLWSCNDEFMNRYPLDEITDNNFWQTAQDLELYSNNFYTDYITGFGTIWGNSKIAPYGYNEGIAYGDVITDNAAPQRYSKVAADQYNDYISDGSGSGGWNWENIRALNYFLDNYQRGDVLPEVRNVYLGEILFFKAWDYFKKVKTFGEVPWLTSSLQTDSPELMDPRTPRAEVMDSVLYILNKSIEYLPAKGAEKPDRLNKDIALHLKSRICLYEGTYRKYHTELGLDGTKFLKEAVEASEALIMSGTYDIYSTGNPNDDYYNLFATYTYENNPEAILWREYSADLNYGVAFSRYYAQNARHRHGATRSLVDEYLCTDGLPISESGLFMGKDSIQSEMMNRDPRLPQTVANFGTYNLQDGVMGAENAPLPNLPGLNGNSCPTGYRVAKWFLNDPADWNRVTRGMQAALVFRYAEVLLNYAEAKYELEGSISQTVLDATVNKIRSRVDMPPLKVGNAPNDPVLDGNYAKYCGYVPDAILREIRRERRVELAFESFRWDDLMRWKAGRFLEIPVEGIKFVQEQFPTVVIDKDVFLSKDGYILPYYQVLPDGRKFDEAKQYLFPIPIEDLILNPNLDQNPKWQAPN